MAQAKGKKAQPPAEEPKKQATVKGPPCDILLARLKKSNVALAKRGDNLSRSQVEEVIPLGVTAFDHYLFGTCGGIPVGRMGEILGDADCGKTSLGFAILGAAQRAGGIAILVETERTLQVQRAVPFGVNLTSLVLSEPDDTEDVLTTIIEILQAIPDGVGPNAIVWDSIASAELKGQADKGFNKPAFVGRKGYLMSSALPVFSRLLKEKRCALIFINQIRDKIGVFFGDSTTTPGGHAPKFQSSWRAQMWRGSTIKDSHDEPIGVYTTIKLIKSKVCLPFHKAKFQLYFHAGWDEARTLVALGRSLKLVPPKKPFPPTPENLALLRQQVIDLHKREVIIPDDPEIIEGALEESPLEEGADPYSAPGDAEVDLSGTAFA